MYVLRGGEANPDAPLIGGVSLLDLCEDDVGGVFGRAEFDERDLSIVLAYYNPHGYTTNRLSNASMSACEYDAPTTNPGSRACFTGEEFRRPLEVLLRQNGEDVLDSSQRCSFFMHCYIMGQWSF